MQTTELATGLQFPEGPIAMDDGSIVLVEIARGTLTRVSPDGSVTVVAELGGGPNGAALGPDGAVRSEEHTSELQSLMRISYAVFCLKKKKREPQHHKQPA